MGVEPAEAPDVAARLRGFGPLGLVAIVLVLAGVAITPAIAAVLVLIWARLSRTPWQSLGFRAPRNHALTIAGGVAFGIALKLVLKAIVMPLIGAPPRNLPFQFLVGNSAALPGMLAIVIFGAGVAEEIFFRGYVFERLGRLMGGSRAALAATVVFSAAFFAIAHYPGQGVPGVEQAAIVGAIFGLIYARQKQIWVLMCAHAAFDVTAVLLIYLNWEAPLAHLIFN